MRNLVSESQPQIVLHNGRPSAVILDIKVYERMLERLEEKDDLEALAAMRKKPMKFRHLGEFLAERKSHV